jgi:hypothetical protein
MLVRFSGCMLLFHCDPKCVLLENIAHNSPYANLMGGLVIAVFESINRHKLHFGVTSHFLLYINLAKDSKLK